ncbi:MAG: ParA family protein [Magnetococcus sp. WYHC-3]
MTMITVVGNLKGGCGKSTVAFNLSVLLAHLEVPVVSFDLDPQATLSDVNEVRLEEGVQPEVRVLRPESDPGRVLRQHEGEIIVDVGASNLWAMRQAIGMADRILIPVPPSQADVWSTQRFLDIISETTGKQGRVPEIILFINRADTHPGLKESDETAEALHALDGLRVSPHRLGQRTAFRRSFSEGRAVFELTATGKATEELLALAGELYPTLDVNGWNHKKKG